MTLKSYLVNFNFNSILVSFIFQLLTNQNCEGTTKIKTLSRTLKRVSRHNDIDNTKAGWLKDCDNTTNPVLNIRASQCSNGIWVEKELVEDTICLCANGLWVLSSEFCDINPFIVYGQGDCFYTRKKIRKITFLGIPEAPFSPSTFVARRNSKLTFDPQNIDKSSNNNKWLTNIGNNSLIVRINPQTDYYLHKPERKTKIQSPSVPSTNGSKTNPNRICIDEKSDSRTENTVSLIKIIKTSELLQIQESTHETNIENNLQNILYSLFQSPKSNCNLQTKINSKKLQTKTIHLKVGYGLKLGRDTIRKLSENCKSKKCKSRLSEKHKNKNKISFINENKNEITDENDPQRIRPTSLRKKRQAVSEMDTTGFFGYSLNSGPTATEDNLKQLITEQNIRLIKAEMRYMKSRQKHPSYNFDDPNYQFLQVARQILNAACPIEDVSDFLTKSILRIFRYLLVERNEDNTYGDSSINDTNREKMMGLLKTCLNETQPMQFSFRFEPEDCRDENKPTDKANPPKPVTPPQADYDNAADQNAKDAVKNKYQDELTAWQTAIAALPMPPKLCTCRKVYEGVYVNETHNNTCTALNETLEWDYPNKDLITETVWKIFEFTHHMCARYFKDDGTDLSIYHERVERFFHADVIFRWFNPGHNADRLWEYFFFGYSLPTFTRAMDSCLCAAKTHSEYQEYMRRPMVPTFRRKRDLSRENMVPSLSSTKKGSRSMLSQLDFPTVQTNQHLKCLRHPWDPIQQLDFHSKDMLKSCVVT